MKIIVECLDKHAQNGDVVMPFVRDCEQEFKLDTASIRKKFYVFAGDKIEVDGDFVDSSSFSIFFKAKSLKILERKKHKVKLFYRATCTDRCIVVYPNYWDIYKIKPPTQEIGDKIARKANCGDILEVVGSFVAEPKFSGFKADKISCCPRDFYESARSWRLRNRGLR